MSDEIEYRIDKNDGSIYERRITEKKVHVIANSMIANVESISVTPVSDETFFVYKFKGGSIVSQWNVHVPNTVQVRYPLEVESNGEYLFASSKADVVLDRALLLTNFDVTDGNSNDQYRCKPFFMVKMNGRNSLISTNELDYSYFYFVGIGDKGAILFIPPLSNIYDDGRMCNGYTLMKSRNPKPFKAEQLREHFELSMGNFDLSTSYLERYARWDINEKHVPESDKVFSNRVSGERNEIVQAVVNHIRGTR